MDGEQWIPPTKSRQPGTVKSLGATNATTTDIKTSDSKGDIGISKHIGFDLGKQLQTKDTGLHLQP
jgi:hypothetical protein